jgi:hypothetical protein
MYESEEERRSHHDVTIGAPPLRLAGVDEEDDAWEPHIVRGID